MPMAAGVILRRIKDKIYADVGRHDIKPGDKVKVAYNFDKPRLCKILEKL